MNESNFDTMNRDELARFIVAHRDTKEGIEARRIYINRMAEKAKSRGIELRRYENSSLSSGGNEKL
jgi:uncharacterized protein with von Willebrand factor type A (vWA) domain